LTDPSKIQKDNILVLTHYVRVNAANPNKASVVDIDTGLNFDIQGKALLERCLTGDQHSKVQKVTKTEAAQLLISAFNKPIKLAFEKTDGSLREMRCRLVSPEPLLGRSMVEDLDIADPKDRIRQADHRTLKWIVLDDIRYEVKK
jgi:hypothetical protein